jgi:hypothetical protein
VLDIAPAPQGAYVSPQHAAHAARASPALASAEARCDRLLTLTLRVHARARSEALARAAMLLWYQFSAASRHAAAATADIAAANHAADLQLQLIATQLAASAEAQRKRLQHDLMSSFRSIVSHAAPSRSLSSRKAGSCSADSTWSSLLHPQPPPRPVSPAAAPSRLDFLDESCVDADDAAGARDAHEEAADLSDFAGDVSTDTTRSDVATGRRLMSHLPFVWLVLRRALGRWRCRHAGDYRRLKLLRDEQQLLQQLHLQQQQQWEQRELDLLATISSTESVLQLERWCVAEGD